MSNQAPKRLFHYQPFVVEHLVSLLSERRIKFSCPNNFNDPWDCRVHYQIPKSPEEITRALDWLREVDKKHGPTKTEIQREQMLEAHRADPSKMGNLVKALEHKMYEAISKQYRVYCLSEIANNQLMWAHYAKSHTGICLEFDATVAPFTTKTGITKVQYHKYYPSFDVATGGHKALFIKSDAWAYECEWRLIAEEKAFAREPETLKTENDFFVFPSNFSKIYNDRSASECRDQASNQR